MLEIHQGYTPRQGLGLATKATAMPSEKLAIKTRLTERTMMSPRGGE
jgi:hypothetical protein